jgi:diguanylate cyclase (GGDEF)-like protein
MSERLRKAFEAEAHLIGSIAVSATISIGVASRSSFVDVTTLLGRADAALYDAKGAGRNKVVVAGG